MKITAEPRSDQFNADDLIGGPQEFVISGVRAGTAEQKYDITLEGQDRCWRPPLTVLRIMLAAWGDEASAWCGKRVRLYRDPSIRFGKDQVGGIRISHLSGIDKPLDLMLTDSRAHKSRHVIEMLPDAPSAPTAEDVAACTDTGTLGAMWRASGVEMRAVIEARVAEIKAEAAELDGPLIGGQS